MHNPHLTSYLAKAITDEIGRSANEPDRLQTHELRTRGLRRAPRVARRRRRAR